MYFVIHHTEEFQSTLPRGERLSASCFACSFCCFNPRSHEGSDREKQTIDSCIRCFNPRSHEGSDFWKEDVTYQFLVSIHAPTRGATDINKMLERYVGVSIHAPTRGATSRNNIPRLKFEVSIHAPTRGATFPSFKNFGLKLFQSTLPRGERQQFRPKILCIFS